MARRRKASATDVLSRLKADPLKYIAGRFNAMDDDHPEKLDIALQLLPYAYAKPRARLETDEAITGVAIVEFGGDE